jgi:hypothetical protein
MHLVMHNVYFFLSLKLCKKFKVLAPGNVYLIDKVSRAKFLQAYCFFESITKRLVKFNSY